MFPQLLKNDNIVFCTNPHKFSVKGLNLLGSSGQNIEDICRFRDMSGKNHLDVLKDTLKIRHMAPTCPDTLRSYPFEDEDPLIIREAPHVYYSCNSNEFNSSLETQMNGSIRLFTVPIFAEFKQVVFLDLHSLVAYGYKISLDDAELVREEMS
mmetsp:Transcript_20620/g.18260  ORF Transcript_20620/g.18260 Transcript_20620/m.18260 type:complete len:153 (-) Transcript_20620:23-481(-)